MLTEALKAMGLTYQEAQIYIKLAEEGAQTGYEIANGTGIARANVYSALASMVDKGAVHRISEEPARYVATPPQEFTSNVIRMMGEYAQIVVENLKPRTLEADVVISLEGEEVILNKVLNLIDGAQATIYLDAWALDLARLKQPLKKAGERGVKVVIISLGPCPVEGMLVYENRRAPTWLVGDGRPVRLIVDSRLMLNGELGRGRLSRGVMSCNASLVGMAKHSFVQEIILAELVKSMGEELSERYGPDFSLIRDKVANPTNK